MVESDPIGEDGGANLYGYVFGSPSNDSDEFGLAVGHHYVPGEVYESLPSSPGRAVFESTTTGPTDPRHRWSKEHKEYNEAVKDMWNDYKKGKNLKKLSEAEAKEFLEMVRCSKNPAIRKFLRKVERAVIGKVVGAATYRKFPVVAGALFLYDTATVGPGEAFENLVWPLQNPGQRTYTYPPVINLNAPPATVSSPLP